MRTALWIVFLAACANPRPAPTRPLGVADHYAEARRHDEEAQRERDRAIAVEQRTGAAVTCGNQTLAEQSTSGGKPISLAVPCWTSHDAAHAHLRRAEHLQRDAHAHRAIAKNLLEAERAACAPLPESERDHSPSWHREDVVSVEPLRDGGPVVGARIVFRKVEGLTADWLRTAYACHRAEAAVAGFDPTFMSYCPASVVDAEVEVTDRADGIEVTFRSHTKEGAAVIWGRASDLAPKTSAANP